MYSKFYTGVRRLFKSPFQKAPRDDRAAPPLSINAQHRGGCGAISERALNGCRV
jgi:hypothetical protein